MDILATLAVIAGIVFIGFISDLIFQKFGIPDVLILIFVGIGLSSILKWTDANAYGNGAILFTTFALIFILFQGALNIHFKTLMSSLPKTLKLTILNFFFTILIVTLITKFMGYDWMISLLIGAILAGTSSAVVIPLIHTVDITDKYGLILKLESALSDVLCIIGTVTIIEIIETGSVQASGVFNSILSSFSLAIVVGLIVGFIWVYLLKEYEILINAYMLTIAIVIALYAFVESPFVGGSGAISALTFGLVMGNSREILNMNNKSDDKKEDLKHAKLKKHIKHIKNGDKTVTNVLSPSAKTFYSEISFFVKTFFFVYLGTLIDFTNPKVFLYGLIVSIGIYLIRPFSVYLSFKEVHLENRERALLEVMIPKGLAAAVLAGVAVQSGILGEASSAFTNLVLSVILISIILTSILVFLAEKGIFKGFFTRLNKST